MTCGSALVVGLHALHGDVYGRTHDGLAVAIGVGEERGLALWVTRRHALHREDEAEGVPVRAAQRREVRAPFCLGQLLPLLLDPVLLQG